MRPVGGVVFGYVGDKYGRKVALISTILLMSAATFTMGCLPGYAIIGAAAPILLTIVRLAQGLSVGGQLVGSFVFTVENAEPGTRALQGAIAMGSSSFGTGLGSAVAAILHAALPTESLMLWGWRLPFLSGILAGILALILHLKVQFWFWRK